MKKKKKKKKKKHSETTCKYFEAFPVEGYDHNNMQHVLQACSQEY